ncbi:MAG: hypothetical protein KGO02_22815 [Alphaproteobacteria bacterium]|nr:hypothetical protein [Alphaproteobacteria bacterium]
MKSFVKLGVGTAMLVSLAFTGPAFAHTAPAKGKIPTQRAPSCFFVNQFDNWKSPNPKTIYINTNFNRYYRLDLAGKYPMLRWPDAYLVMNVVGPDTICSPLDWDLTVASRPGGFSEHLIVRKMTELTSAEVAAIPDKFRP